MLGAVSHCVHSRAGAAQALASHTASRNLERSHRRSVSQSLDLATTATAGRVRLDDSWGSQRQLRCADSGNDWRGKEGIIKGSIKDALFISLVGYVLLVGSALMVSTAIRLITGYYPSFTFFTLALITFRLVELHHGYLLAPPLLALVVITFLSRTPLNVHLSAGVGLSSYYILVVSIFLLAGAAEFSTASAIPWVVWAFVVGVASSVIVDGVQIRVRSS